MIVFRDEVDERLARTLPRSALARLTGLVGSRVPRTQPRVALLLGAAVGAAVGAAAAAKKADGDGNTISGDVAIHLLNKIELVTIRLEVRQVPKAGKGSSSALDLHRSQNNEEQC